MKSIILSFFIFFFTLSLCAQTGKVMDNLSLPSKILKSDRKYAIYLPLTMNHRSVVIRYCIYYMAQEMIRPVGFNLAKCFTLPTRLFVRAKQPR
jgi:hypothetical protein